MGRAPMAEAAHRPAPMPAAARPQPQPQAPAVQPQSEPQASAATQQRLAGLDPKERIQSARAEEELFEIPAFLRRQAN
jgi:cell division protein FtsZ